MKLEDYFKNRKFDFEKLLKNEEVLIHEQIVEIAMAMDKKQMLVDFS